jgi:ribosome-binding factor A
MGSKRVERVSCLLKREVAEMLTKEVKDPRIGMVTITGVKLSSDLRYAHIYYSVVGSEKEIRDSAIGLNRATKFIQRKLGRRIRLRYTPIIDFQFDHSLEYGSRIEEILQTISSSSDNISEAEVEKEN